LRDTNSIDSDYSMILPFFKRPQGQLPDKPSRSKVTLNGGILSRLLPLVVLLPLTAQGEVPAATAAMRAGIDAAQPVSPQPQASPPAIANPAQAQPAAVATPTAKPDANASMPFDIWEYRVIGNSVLSTDSIQRTVYPYLGPHRSIEDVEKARSTLEALYHQQGYQTVFVNIPEQDVNGGLVKLEVTEGKVEHLKVSGSRYFSLGHIKAGVPALAEGQVPHMPSVEKQLTALAAQSSDRQISPVLKVGDRPGTLDAELKVRDELPLHGSLEMNGRNSVGTSYSRLLATVRYDNLWQLNHSASLQYLVAPESQDVQVWSGTYALPLFDPSNRLAFYGVGVDSSSAVAASGALGVLGSGNIFGLRLSHTLEPIGGFFHSVSGGVDYKHFNQGLVLSTSTTNTPITYLPFTVGYSGGLRHEDSMTTFGMEGHFSIRGLLNNQPEFEDRRFLAQSNYFYFTADVKHQHKLPWGLGLALRAAGQVADGPLISYEQFSAGGAYSVRGYHETQELGDDGLMGSVELHSPQLLPEEWDFVRDAHLLAFLDGAKLWTLDALPGTPSQVALAAVGLGMRLDVWKRVIGELDWAYPMIRAGNVGPGNQRIHFRLAYEF